MGDGRGDTHPAVRLTAVTQVHRFVGAARRTGRRDGAAGGPTGELHVHFDGGPSAGVPDSSAVHVGDRCV